MWQTTIGTRIRELRKERCLTQEDLAAKACKDTRTIQRIESGAQEPRLGTTKAIAEALRVSVAELRGGRPAPGPAPHAERPPGGHVTLIASQNGGTGITTLAISLSGALRTHEYRVLLVDFDETRGVQPYLTWAGTLRKTTPQHFRFDSLAQATQLIPKLRDQYDHVVIDSSTCETSDLVPLALRCDQVLLTTNHPQLDFGWGRHRTETWLDVANVYRVDVAAVLMCASRYTSRRLEARRYLERMELSVLKTELVNRTAYDRAVLQGTTVVDDDPTGLAAGEVYALAHELGWMEFLQTPRSLRDRRWTKEDTRFLRMFTERAFLRNRTGGLGEAVHDGQMPRQQRDD